MKVTVRNAISDNLRFFSLVLGRKQRIRRAAAQVHGPGPVNRLATLLHPRCQKMVVESGKHESPTTMRFRLVPAEPGERVAFFRAGQYVSIEETVSGVRVSRPFSISSPPDESAAGNYYDITVRSADDGFVAPVIMESWGKGHTVSVSDPQGFFYYEQLRDFPRIVGLAGGSGVTPFRSMIPDLLAHHPDIQIVLLHGTSTENELIFREEFLELAMRHDRRFSYVPVCERPDPGSPVAAGYLSADLIAANVAHPAQTSFFVCGPPAMRSYVSEQLGQFDLRPKQIRRENSGGRLGTLHVGSARGGGGPADGQQEYVIRIQVEGHPGPVSVPARSDETVLVSLERAGLNPPAFCRSGECGWCRAHLLGGKVVIPEDHRRAADKKFSYIHVCSAYPESDLELRIPRNPNTG